MQKKKFVADIVYEDGDEEEMYLDQLVEFLLPAETAAPSVDMSNPGGRFLLEIERDRFVRLLLMMKIFPTTRNEQVSYHLATSFSFRTLASSVT